MDKYNAEHYVDYTAAIAVSRADRARRRLKKEPIRRLAGLTYKIGEVVQLTWVCNMLATQERVQMYKTLGEAVMSGEATGYTKRRLNQ
ncbi:hypothetical protein [Christensenella tenuis]|uniref:Uncharacterized protein n=1 Tax=Christensenella tenuis TaxID=2763033 RepID=A0ABR7EH51_9FIRM|nr:hypothetical protein [Christensenella tenuis]MBC5648493.1 hypothetical protein [Christensenella tenuis]